MCAPLCPSTGVEVTLVDANHCPGAVQLCFQVANGARYLHCGDARYCAAMQRNTTLQRFVGARAVFLVLLPPPPPPPPPLACGLALRLRTRARAPLAVHCWARWPGDKKAGGRAWAAWVRCDREDRAHWEYVRRHVCHAPAGYHVLQSEIHLPPSGALMDGARGRTALLLLAYPSHVPLV